MKKESISVTSAAVGASLGVFAWGLFARLAGPAIVESQNFVSISDAIIADYANFNMIAGGIAFTVLALLATMLSQTRSGLIKQGM